MSTGTQVVEGFDGKSRIYRRCRRMLRMQWQCLYGNFFDKLYNYEGDDRILLYKHGMKI